MLLVCWDPGLFTPGCLALPWPRAGARRLLSEEKNELNGFSDAHVQFKTHKELLYKTNFMNFRWGYICLPQWELSCWPDSKFQVSLLEEGWATF